MSEINFNTAFEALTGKAPFPWQAALYKRFCEDRPDNIPSSCNLPTGLGKTSVIAVWLIALANGKKVPRRLVYVVNRRTVVDQTTDEVEMYRRRLELGPPWPAILGELAVALGRLSAISGGTPLAISTLRGQFADNREWSADPSRPAVICGTVDMIGSRLLFSGYGCGFRTRPLHAGFLGQDSLVIHDEAHLEPAFQKLLLDIEAEQKRERGQLAEKLRLRVMELTATSRAGEAKPFGLTEDDFKNETVTRRVKANKQLILRELDKKLADDVAKYAKAEPMKDKAVVIFVRGVKEVDDIIKKLPAGTAKQLTGTLRGYERDGLVKHPIFQRFLPESNRDKRVTPQPGTVYLVCTSAGEVGVNISADHLVCDLSTFDSMAQRFGRVNRFGTCTDTEIHVIYPNEFKDDELGKRLQKTLGLLGLLNGNASPAELGELRDRAIREGAGGESLGTSQTQALREYIEVVQNHAREHPEEDVRVAAFAPPPTILPTSDILFDVWALTTIRDKLPGRPEVTEYLHGVEDEKERETHVAWRDEVELFANPEVPDKDINEFLDDFPIRPHELLRDATYRVHEQLAELAAKHEAAPVWVIDPDDTVRVLKMGDLAKEDNKKKYVENLSGRTVVLSPRVGGLTSTGTISGDEEFTPERLYDVASAVAQPSGAPLVRFLVFARESDFVYRSIGQILRDTPTLELEIDAADRRIQESRELRECCVEAKLGPMRVAYRLDLPRDPDSDADGPLEFLVLKPEKTKEKTKHDKAWPSLQEHLDGVKQFAVDICSRLGLPPDIERAAIHAAAWHDLGKARSVWQRGAGNLKPGTAPVAKTIHGRPPENLNGFRHELASMVDVCSPWDQTAAFDKLTPECQDLLLHMIATHHGRGRPHFPLAETDDPGESTAAARQIASDTPQRFARLQRNFGRWGLAYLESLLRAADTLDSKRIEDAPIGDAEAKPWPKLPRLNLPAQSLPTPTITVKVDPTNPGQFFACCGLLELADRLWPGAEGWITEGKFNIACGGTLEDLVARFVETGLSSALTPELQAERDTLERRKRELKRERKSLPKQDEERRKELGTLFREGSIRIGSPFELLLDWWQSEDDANPKTWAGSQAVIRIASAALGSMSSAAKASSLLDFAGIMRANDSEVDDESSEEGDKVEPYYFDSRRGPNAHSRDVGFSANDLGLTTTAFPAVELLCLVGLQRCLPAKTAEARIYDYFTWAVPLAPVLLPAAVPGLLPGIGTQGYRFENWFRTGQRKHKAFRSAIPLSKGSAQ